MIGRLAISNVACEREALGRKFENFLASILFSILINFWEIKATKID